MIRNRSFNSFVRLLLRGSLTVLLSVSLGACVTSRIEDTRQSKTGLNEGEGRLQSYKNEK